MTLVLPIKFDIKWPLKVVQGHVSWETTRNCMSLYNAVGCIMMCKGSEDKAIEISENCRFLFSTIPCTVVWWPPFSRNTRGYRSTSSNRQ